MDPVDPAVRDAIQAAVADAVKPVLSVMQREIRSVTQRLTASEEHRAETDQTVDTLNQVVADLGDTVAGALARKKTDQPPVPRVSWLTIPADSKQAAAVTRDLVDWLRTVYMRVTGESPRLPQLPGCWPIHPLAVEQLLTLRHAHHEAFTRSSASTEDAYKWLTEKLPTVAQNLAADCKCDADAPAHTQGRDTAGVPLGEYAVRSAPAWAKHKRMPPLTEIEVAAVDRYKRRREWGGATAQGA